MGAAAAIPAVLGAVGLYQQNQQSNAARKAANKAGDVSKAIGTEQLSALMKLREIADKYDPEDSTRKAIESASAASAQTLEQALRRMKVGYGGGNPEGDTGFAVSAQRHVNDNLDPLKLFAANEMANMEGKRADMYQRILGAPTGQIADSFLKAAAMMPQSNPSGSLAMLSGALERIFNKKGGAGGSGDAGGPNAPPTAGSGYWDLYGGLGY